jgi:hypothetical protein
MNDKLTLVVSDCDVEKASHPEEICLIAVPKNPGQNVLRGV